MNLEALKPYITTNFGGFDWLIVGLYLLISVAVGIYANRFISNMTDYVVAGRGLKTYLALATMTGTELGLVTVMYSAQKGFSGGFAAFHIALAAAIVTFVVGITGFIVVPLRRMKVMTIPEFYEKRFDRSTRIFGGGILAFSGILNMGMFLKAGSLFVAGVTGLTDTTSVNLIMTVLLAIVLFYTILGGMVSVVITDYIQFVVLAFGMLIASFLSVKFLGWDTIIETVKSVKGVAGFNPFDEQGFGTPYVIWMVFLGLAGCAIWQTAVMRACAMESTRVVRKVYMWSSVSFLIRFLIPYLWGICAFVFIASHPDLKRLFIPGNGGPAVDTLLAMPIFFARVIPAGLIGIITAGMLAAFMSTHDSYLLCWSSVITQDVLNPLMGGKLSTRTRIKLTRIIIFSIGIFLLIWGLWYPLAEDLWDYMVITGAVYFTGGFALLLGGLYWKRASSAGAKAALVSGFLAIFALKPVQDLFNFNIRSETVGIGTVCIATALMFLFSLLFPDKKEEAVQP